MSFDLTDSERQKYKYLCEIYAGLYAIQKAIEYKLPEVLLNLMKDFFWYLKKNDIHKLAKEVNIWDETKEILKRVKLSDETRKKFEELDISQTQKINIVKRVMNKVFN